MSDNAGSGSPGATSADAAQGDSAAPAEVRHPPTQRFVLERYRACEPLQESWETTLATTHWSGCDVHKCEQARPGSMPAAVSSSFSRLPRPPWRHIMRCGHEMLSLTSACSINCSEKARKSTLDSDPATCPICGTSDFTTYYWRVMLYCRASLAEKRRLAHVYRHHPEEQDARLRQSVAHDDEFFRDLHDTRLYSQWMILSAEEDLVKAYHSIIEYCNDVINGWMKPLRDIEPANGERLPVHVRNVSHFYGMSPADEYGHMPIRWETPVLVPADEPSDPQDWVPYTTVPDFAFLGTTGPSENAQSAVASLELASLVDSADSGATVTAPGFSHDLIHRTDNEHAFLVPADTAVKIKGRGKMLRFRGVFPRVLARAQEKTQGTAGSVFQGLVRNVTDRKDRTSHFIRLILEPSIHEIFEVEMPAEELEAQEEEARLIAARDDLLEDRERLRLEAFFRRLDDASGGYFGDTFGDHRIPWTRAEQDMHDLQSLNRFPYILPDIEEQPQHVQVIFDFLQMLWLHPDTVFYIPGEQPVTGPVQFIWRLEQIFGVDVFEWTTAHTRHWRDVVVHSLPHIPPHTWGAPP